ncbi:MAG: HDIG domain-containing protein [Gemmatimonadales bacterium]|nr:HDIG domain-containing protein [Gemmatimonadales bacterium]
MDEGHGRELQDLPVRGGRGIRLHALRWGLLAAVAALTCLVYPAPRVPASPVYEANEKAARTIIAPIPFIVRKSDDEIAREGDRRALAVRPVYRFSAAALASALTAARDFFHPPARPGVLPELELAQSPARVRQEQDEARHLADPVQRAALRTALLSFLSRTLSEGVADAGALRAERSDRIYLLRADAERVVPRDSVLTFADFMDRAERAAPADAGPVGERLFRRLAAAFFYPTIVADPALTARRREQFRLGVDSVKYDVPAGERIVGAHEVVSPEVRDKLLGLRDALQRRGTAGPGAASILGPFLYNALILAPFWLLAMFYRRDTYARFREMAFFAGLFSAVIVLTHGVADVFPGRPELLPIPAAVIIIAMLYDGRMALAAASTLAILIGGQWELRPNDTLFFALVGGVAAAVSVRVIRRRRRLYVTVGVMAAAYALAALAVGLSSGWTWGAMVSSALAGLVAAIGTTAVAMLMLPIAESVTRITTDLTLLELADPSRPLLRRLTLEAPGTWAHSLAMANLCEAGCTAIGANGLLARVGCYYHDVGKLGSPRYFVENQARGANPHDALPPEESAKIIRDHVEAGLRLAEEHRLPRVVRAFIPEHHGTTDIRTFLHRARDRAHGTAIDPAQFRYPGPRPRSAETAVVMLADSAEAAVRAIDHPTADAVRRAVDDVVAQRLSAGQLDNAPLTLRDIDRVKEEFVRLISGMYHERGEYPRPSDEFVTVHRGAVSG